MSSNILENTTVANGCVQMFPGGGNLKFKNLIATTTTTADCLVNSGATFLHAIIVNTTSGGAITIYNAIAPAGATVGTIKASVVENTFTYNIPLTVGLSIKTASNSDITIVYQDL